MTLRLLLFLPLSVLLSGCMMHAGDILDLPGRDTYHYRNRVDYDVDRYVDWLYDELRLHRQQARRIDRLLTDRTHDLLDRSRPGEHHRVYPFPRRDANRMSRTVHRWWSTADRAIERHLDRQQRRHYRYLTDPRDRRYSRRGRR